MICLKDGEKMENKNSLVKISMFLKIKRWFNNIFNKKKVNNLETETNSNYSYESEKAQIQFKEQIRVEDHKRIIEEFELQNEKDFTLDRLKKINNSYKNVIDNLIYNIELLGNKK